jgi:Ca2+-binding RTX toxin-like protein
LLTPIGTLNVHAGTYTENVDLGAGVDKAVNLAPGASPGQVVINGDLTLTANDTLIVELNGALAGSGYDQLVVNGAVDLGSASLSATAAHAYPIASFITLIDNDLADLNAGTFAGHSDGDTIVISGQSFVIFHNGGSGNDVLLVKAFPGGIPPVTYAEDLDWDLLTPGTIVDGDLSTPDVFPFGADIAFIDLNAFRSPTALDNAIQQAVDAVIADGTGRVVVNEGLYPENVFVNKSLTIEGRLIDASNATINPAAGVGLTVNSSSFITVRDINIAAPIALDIDMSGTVSLENLNTAGSAAGGSIDDVDNLLIWTRDNAGDTFDVNAAADGQFSSGEIDPTSFGLITNFTLQTRGGDDMISAKPTLAGQAMNLHIVGGTPNFVGVPTGDVAGDKLILDMSDTTGPVIVSTVSGLASSVSHRPLTFAEIEDIDLIDDGAPTNVVMGDLYIRGTNATDIVQFNLTKLGTPGVTPTQTRVRVNNQFHNLLVSNRVLAYGRGGNDYLQMINLPLPAEFYGEGNDDYMTGYTGNDLLVGGLGNDRLLAGDGDNVLWGDNVGEQDLVAGGIDQLTTGTGTDIAYGGGGNDTINLGSNNDYAYGGAGNDTIDGQAGDDRLYGGADNDTISGSDGNDVISGNGGNDRLYGKNGNDVVIGGDGADIVNGDGGNDLLFDALVTYDDPGTLLPAGNEASSTKDGSNDLAMAALLADWLADGAVNAAFLTVAHDAFIDTISGGTGTDTAYRKAADPNKDTVLEVETQLP